MQSGELCFLPGLLLTQKAPFQKENYKLLRSIVTHCVLVCVCACTCAHVTHIFVHFWICKQTHTHTQNLMMLLISKEQRDLGNFNYLEEERYTD